MHPPTRRQADRPTNLTSRNMLLTPQRPPLEELFFAVFVQERIDISLVDARKGARRQDREHMGVGPGRRPGLPFPPRRLISGRQLAAFPVRAGRLDPVGGLTAPEPA